MEVPIRKITVYLAIFIAIAVLAFGSWRWANSFGSQESSVVGNVNTPELVRCQLSRENQEPATVVVLRNGTVQVTFAGDEKNSEPSQSIGEFHGTLAAADLEALRVLVVSREFVDAESEDAVPAGPQGARLEVPLKNSIKQYPAESVMPKKVREVYHILRALAGKAATGDFDGYGLRMVIEEVNPSEAEVLGCSFLIVNSGNVPLEITPPGLPQFWSVVSLAKVSEGKEGESASFGNESFVGFDTQGGQEGKDGYIVLAANTAMQVSYNVSKGVIPAGANQITCQAHFAMRIAGGFAPQGEEATISLKAVQSIEPVKSPVPGAK